MKIKGSCYFSHIHNQHVIIILSESDENGNALLVPLSSIKFKKNGQYQYQNQLCSYYDNSCIINSDEIISENGKNVLSKPTYALYKFAGIISENNIAKAILSGNLEYRYIINNELLKRIQKGAITTAFLEEHFKKYFDLF